MGPMARSRAKFSLALMAVALNDPGLLCGLLRKTILR